jgi:hypothetical protein
MTAKATIESFQTPVTLGHAAQVKAKVTQGHPDKFRWQYMTGGSWKTAGEVPATSLTYEYLFPAVGQYPIRLQSMVAGNVTDTTGTPRTIVVLKNPDPPQPPTKTVFRAFRGQYVCTEPSNYIAVNRPTQAQAQDPNWKPGPWETYTKEPQGNGIVAYRSEHGTYITADGGGGGPVSCNQTRVTPDGCFTEEARPNGGFACKTRTGFYLCADYNKPVPDGCELNATRTSAGDYETFYNANPVPPPPPPGTVTKVHPDGHVFRHDDGSAFRWKGVSAFQLCDRWLRGDDLTPFLSAYQGFNLLRVWSYVEPPNWTDPVWASPNPDEAVAFVKEMNRLGWYVEWTLKTSSQPSRNAHALDEIHAFTAAGLAGLFLEGANEPEVQNPDSTFIDCGPLKTALEASGYPYTNGCYTDGARRWWGTYLSAHTRRTDEWVRYSHDAYDYWVKPADAPPGAQAVHAPCVLDEPAKLQDVGGDRVSDWKAYFGSAGFFAAGATFHAQTAKFAQPPTAEEAQLAACALVGLNAFPEDAPTNFDYQRIDDNTLRTYRMGNCMCRMRPTTAQAPQPGWTMIDSAAILWRR